MSEHTSTVPEAVKHLLGAIGTQVFSTGCLIFIINQPAPSKAPVSQLSSLVDFAHISAGFKPSRQGLLSGEVRKHTVYWWSLKHQIENLV